MLMSGDAINCHWRHGCLQAFTPAAFPPTTLIRLYEFLKNDSRYKQSNWPTHRMCSPLSALVSLGGGERDRTDDPLLAKQVLSQLS